MQPEPSVVRAAVCLGRSLRDAGIPTGIDQELGFYRALAEVDLSQRSQVYWAARAFLVHDPHLLPRFDHLFQRFWLGLPLQADRRGAEHGESDPRLTGPQHGGESMPQYRLDGRSGALIDGQLQQASTEVPTAGANEDGGGNEQGAMAAYSHQETIADPRDLEYGTDELAAVRQLAEELRQAMPERRSRRPEVRRGRGRLEVRRTVRRAMRTMGEPVRPAYVGPSRRPRRLLFICDVSGSMDRYSRLLLASLKAAVSANRKAEAFVFATRLTRLTAALSHSDVERALRRSRAQVTDWAGGTRIGEVLAAFNREWTGRGLARGGIVVVISDGWDRGDPEVLAREVRRLQLQSRRLIWVNPRPGDVSMQPLAIGMRAALPHVDDYVPGHDSRALAGLGSLVSGVDKARPARRRWRLDSVRA